MLGRECQMSKPPLALRARRRRVGLCGALPVRRGTAGGSRVTPIAVTQRLLSPAHFAQHFLLHLDLDTLVLDAESDTAEQRHVHIRDPYKREEREEVAPPIVEQERVARD